MPSIIATIRRVKGPRRDNHHVRFFGVIFRGFAFGVLLPFRNKKSKEQADADMRDWMDQKMFDYRFSRSPERN